MGVGEKIINFFKINGITHQVSGNHIEIKDNKVFVDKKEITTVKEKHLEIEWKGELANLTIHRGNVTCGDVGGDVEAEGNVICKNVSGNVDSQGNVSCEDVTGSIDTQGNVKAGNVGEYIDTEGNVTCGDIGEYVDTEGNVICKNIKGDITNAEMVKVER